METDRGNDPRRSPVHRWARAGQGAKRFSRRAARRAVAENRPVNPAQHALIFAVRVYRWTLSPLLRALFGAACRFEPSCSHYALDAVRAHGARRGGWLALRRLARCHPWGGCGCDPVPEASSKFKVQSSKWRVTEDCGRHTAPVSSNR
ncbi:MAG: membrane protein insertion efficiency factor YidD [Verrucomicrobia bacterium]|nr:membrane protein insertion efficiency factor YidD [Verrucomicrobiota bacterium]